jgi:hypothetical protein
MVTKVNDSEKLADPWGVRRTVSEWCKVHGVSPIVKRFGQWCVTSYGLENLCISYPIERTRLWQGDAAYSWETHMSSKPWVVPEDFEAAISEARRYHAKHKPKSLKLSLAISDFGPSIKLRSKENPVPPEFVSVRFPIDRSSTTRLARDPKTTLTKEQVKMTGKMIQIRAAAPGQGDSWCGHCGRSLSMKASIAEPVDLEPTGQELKLAAQRRK